MVVGDGKGIMSWGKGFWGRGMVICGILGDNSLIENGIETWVLGMGLIYGKNTRMGGAIGIRRDSIR
uniref:hypothetical protein n=1 Tax=Paenibacillus xylanexedens TaxID=528191 RepID=UPI001C92D4D9